VLKNAGLLPHYRSERLKSMTEQIMDVNIKGVLYGIAAALPYVKQ
jgi:NADP-dependent 3-hydroxy acid dehydrogenase YdfG